MVESVELPDGFEKGLADEWQALIAQGRRPDQSAHVPDSNEALEALIHPHAEAFIETFDEAKHRLDAGLAREVRQFLHCLSQVVAARLLTLEEIIALRVEVHAALAYAAIAGWLARDANTRGQLALPVRDIDPDVTADLP